MSSEKNKIILWFQKPKTKIYKQLKYAIYLLSIYKNKIDIISTLLEKIMGFIGWKKMGFIGKKNYRVYMEVQKPSKN
jgi:hypothetical protein